MTPVQTRANGLVIPPLPQLWLTAALHMLAELVLNVVSTLRMCFRRDPVIGTQAMPAPLPGEKTDTQQQETQIRDRRAPARQSTLSVEITEALMVSSTQSVRPSNHEGVLTGARQESLGSGPLVRVPREGGDSAPLSTLVLNCSFTAEQASQPALDPRLRGGTRARDRAQISARLVAAHNSPEMNPQPPARPQTRAYFSGYDATFAGAPIQMAGLSSL